MAIDKLYGNWLLYLYVKFNDKLYNANKIILLNWDIILLEYQK